MFTTEERAAVRTQMLERARDDENIVAAALLGSAARSDEDKWSDVDLALRISASTDSAAVLAQWSEWLGTVVAVSDYLDVEASGAVYRVFLCEDTLQIDLSVWESDAFRATNGQPMQLVFGDANPAELPPQPDWRRLARMGWLYALHARSAIKRGRLLQADLMLSHWRETITSLACVRSGLNPADGRGAHLLPRDLQLRVIAARPSELSSTRLHTALAATTQLYLAEVSLFDAAYADQVRGSLETLAS